MESVEIASKPPDAITITSLFRMGIEAQRGEVTCRKVAEEALEPRLFGAQRPNPPPCPACPRDSKAEATQRTLQMGKLQEQGSEAGRCFLEPGEGEEEKWEV